MLVHEWSNFWFFIFRNLIWYSSVSIVIAVRNLHRQYLVLTRMLWTLFTNITVVSWLHSTWTSSESKILWNKFYINKGLHVNICQLKTLSFRFLFCLDHKLCYYKRCNRWQFFNMLSFSVITTCTSSLLVSTYFRIISHFNPIHVPLKPFWLKMKITIITRVQCNI